jgi:hypothetical protein
MTRPTLAILTLLLPGSSLLFAQPQAQIDAPYNQVAQSLKPHLVKLIPATLHEKTENWGHQVMTPVGLKWSGARPRVTRSPRNHGEWRKLVISAQDLPRTLDLRIYDVKNAGADKQTYKVFLTFQMGVYYDQQNWESGVRLWSGSVVARAQVKVDMVCENTLRMELGKNSLPEFVVRLRVTSAKLSYDKLVFEHAAGIGGDGAKVLGKTAHNFVTRARPSFERDILARAGDAIVKTADTKELRVGFGGLSKSK